MFVISHKPDHADIDMVAILSTHNDEMKSAHSFLNVLLAACVYFIFTKTSTSLSRQSIDLAVISVTTVPGTSMIEIAHFCMLIVMQHVFYCFIMFTTLDSTVCSIPTN